MCTAVNLCLSQNPLYGIELAVKLGQKVGQMSPSMKLMLHSVFFSICEVFVIPQNNRLHAYWRFLSLFRKELSVTPWQLHLQLPCSVAALLTLCRPPSFTKCSLQAQLFLQTFDDNCFDQTAKLLRPKLEVSNVGCNFNLLHESVAGLVALFISPLFQ